MGDKFADIATAPIPVGPSGDKPRSISYSWMTVVNAKAAGEAEQKAAWDFLAWLNGPKSGQNGALGDGRHPDVDGHPAVAHLRRRRLQGQARLPFLAGYVSLLADAKPFPVVLGGQEFTEALQKTLEAMQYGQASATDARPTAQTDATSILERGRQIIRPPALRGRPWPPPPLQARA